MEDSINSLLSKVKIEDVIQDYIQLRKRGSNYIGLCPFHTEKTPSFNVSPSRQIYKCFGCGKSGNALSFLIEIKKCDLRDAIQILSNKYDLQEIVISDLAEDEFKLDSIVASAIKPIKLNLNSNIESVFELVKFDRSILDFCLVHLESLETRIQNNEEVKITSVSLYPTNTITLLKNIKQNESLSTMYSSMYNQGVVLLISYLTSSIRDLFVKCLNYWASKNTISFKDTKAEFKITLDELRSTNFNLSNSIGEIILRKKNISFQDMQSTLQEFETYFGVKLTKDEIIDNVILGQAARHAIIHSLAVADEKFINQIRDTELRTLKKEILPADDIKFSLEELEELSGSIKKFFDLLVIGIVHRTK